MTRMVMRALAMLVTLVCGLAGAPAALANWSPQATPFLGLTNGTLTSVSCASSTMCAAVGHYTTGVVQVPLAESWDGTRWSVDPTPNPAGSAMTSLTGVSCGSPTSCVAVGFYTTSVGSESDVMLIERWDGAAWSIDPAPAPPGVTFTTLAAVSCASPTACTAVGSYAKTTAPAAGGMLVERWNGTSWSVQQTPGPRTAGLLAVSCPAATVCMAVGWYFEFGIQRTLALGWNGASWSVQPIPNPYGGTPGSLGGVDGQLAAVSCPSANACTAVGGFGAGDTLAAHWNGAAWSIQQAVPGVSTLNGVSCAAAGTCFATGYYGPGQAPRVDQWNGATWAVTPSPNPPDTNASGLTSVSCTATTACTAVGSYYANADSAYVTLVERWDGVRWSIQSSANPTAALGGRLTGLSCGSPSSCIAFGTDDVGMLVEGWTSGTWSIEPAPRYATDLTGVSCASRNACVAIGWWAPLFNVDSPASPVVDRWNGKTWVNQLHAFPAGTAYANPTSVSCPSDGACEMVGGDVDPGGSEQPLAEQWNGHKWSVQRPVRPAHASMVSLTAISCASRTACLALGTYTLTPTGRALPVLERWNGRVWTTQRSGKPAGARALTLTGVSCPSRAACTVVGNYVDRAGRKQPLAEQYNGRRWSIQRPISPAGAGSAKLTGVSCASRTACTAVGTYTLRDGTTALALVEHWNGHRWAAQQLASPAGATAITVTGVSCPSTTACTVTGSYTAPSGMSEPLAERWTG